MPFEPRGDVDAVAHQVAVALFDDVAEMNADPEYDAAIGRQAGVALDHAVLHLDRATHRVDDAAKLDKDPVAGALDHTAVMGGDGGIDQVAAQPPQRARACDPRPLPRVGYSRRHRQPGSPQFSGISDMARLTRHAE